MILGKDARKKLSQNVRALEVTSFRFWWFAVISDQVIVVHQLRMVTGTSPEREWKAPPPVVQVLNPSKHMTRRKV